MHAEHGGVERRGGGQKDRYQHPDHELGLVNHLHKRDRIADVEQDEQHQQRRDRRAQHQAGHRKERDRDDADDLIGARLDEHERAGEANQPKERPAELLDRQHPPRRNRDRLRPGDGQRRVSLMWYWDPAGISAGPGFRLHVDRGGHQ